MSYYVRINGRSHGPFDESRLVELKSRGTISRATEVSENDHDWCAAEKYEFLYPAPFPSSLSREPAAQEAAESNTPTETEYVYGSQSPEPPFIGIKEKAGSFVQKAVDSFGVSKPMPAPLLSRHTFILLAITVGIFGVHDFYAKRNGEGAIHVACWISWILVLLFSVFIAFLGGLGIHIQVDWFQSASFESADRGVYWMYLFFIVLPAASYVMAMFEIVLVTKDGAGRKFERF